MTSAEDVRNLSVELRLDAQNPWPGLTAFTEKQHEYFFGREQESHELYSCVKRERLTVLFGKSGLGKTSLLQAGLFPQLRDAAYLPVYVRLSYEDEAAPFDTQLRTALLAAIELANFPEVALPQEGESVWEYLHRRGGNLINDEGSVVMPVLVFDQFEECFTLGARKDFAFRLADEFMPGLSEMIENRPPAALTRKLTDDRDLAKRYDLEAHGCRILITLREDYLANLEALRGSMPSLVYIDNRMRLTEMTGEQALSVVVDPSPDLVAPDVAESIVRFVAGAHTDSAAGDVQTVDVLPLKQLEVAPAILSLFCSQLNQERLKSPGMSRITRALVLSQGVTIIEDFYKKCIFGMHPAVRRLIEDRLLTSAGYRDNIDLAEARSTLQNAGANSSCIDDLVRLRLLQIEDHRGVPRLELTHDVLAEPVKHSRNEWKKEEQQEALRQQERDALLRAKQAEQEALKRTHFLQRMVAAAAFVSLLLGAVVVYGWIERREARTNALRASASQQMAEDNEKKAETNAAQAVQMQRQAQDEATIANANKVTAEQNALRADESKRSAQASEKEALESKDRALGMQKQLSGLSSDILDHCVRIYSDFDDAAKNERDDAGKDAIRQLYEQLLMGDHQCLALAEEAHRVDPNNIDVTDDLAMIPVRAAASVTARHAEPRILRLQTQRDFALAEKLPLFQNNSKDDVTQIILARTYMAFAYIFSFVHDDSAKQTSEKGLALLNDIKLHGKSSEWDYHQWDILGDANSWYASYLQSSNQSAAAIAPLIQAFEDEKKAYDLAPKNKIYYGSTLLDRSLRVANSERDLNNSDEAALKSYQESLAIAKQVNDKTRITAIYSQMRIILVRDKQFDQARTLLDQRIHDLLSVPEDKQRQRDLATAYADSAEVEEARDKWHASVDFREKVVTTLAALKPDAYADLSSDLVYAYSLLSWAEIFDGQTQKGIADAQTAIRLSNEFEGHPGLADSYDNGVKALRRNKKYDEAHTLIEQRIQALLNTPKDTQRERDLAAAYTSAAEVEEAREKWVPAVEYRKHAVDVYTAIKPDSYADQAANLIDAYTFLSWAEIFAGQTDQGIADTQKAISLSNAIEGHPGLSVVYDNGIRSLTLNKNPEEALKLLDQRIQTLLVSPKDLQRERDLSSAYRSAAELEESQKHWPKGIDYRTHALDVLVALKPEDYSDQRSDLIYAYSLLAWDEIFNGQIDKGIADTKKAASLSMQTEGHPALNASYENGINALFQNKKYDEAQTLLDAFTQALLAGPAGTDRERELATVVDLDGVQIATIKKQWPQVAKYRADEAKRLAALDPKAYDGLKNDLVEAYGNLSFEDEEAGDFAGAIDAAKSGLKLDDTQSWILENEANGLLLSGDAKDAKTLYLKVKDINWKGVPISKAISDDLLVFCKLGYTPPETSGLARDLGVMTPELDSCLTAAAKAAHPR